MPPSLLPACRLFETTLNGHSTHTSGIALLQMDHMERARREEEAPLLAKLFEEQSKENEQLWHQQQEDAKAAHRCVGGGRACCQTRGWKGGRQRHGPWLQAVGTIRCQAVR